MKNRITVYLLGLMGLLCSVAHLSFRLPSDRVSATSRLISHVALGPVNNMALLLEEYNVMHLDTVGLSLQAFTTAINGYEKLLEKGILEKSGLLTIIDFSQPSRNKRLYVLDLLSNKILFNTYVAHGRKSGLEYPTNFSNKLKSNKSSIGFYVTKNTYNGSHGYSMRLQGLDKGFNDKALTRDIVLHGSYYVNKDFLNSNGFMGRSLGCPAIPMGEHEDIIDNIKEGSCFFIYYPDRNYLRHSSVLKG